MPSFNAKCFRVTRDGRKVGIAPLGQRYGIGVELQNAQLARQLYNALCKIARHAPLHRPMPEMMQAAADAISPVKVEELVPTEEVSP